MTSPFLSIAKHRVTATNPPKDGAELDWERCATLHNSIAIYGWVRSGRQIVDMDRRPWWTKHGSTILERYLRPSLVRFLKKVFELPTSNFFYYVSGLAGPKQMAGFGDLLADEEHEQKPQERNRFITLYLTSKDLVTKPNGIIYDQATHKAIFMPTLHHIFNLNDSSLPWQRLETILSVYIDMIESGKAVALHSSVGKTLEMDPYSGVRRSKYNTDPWALVPYTHGDLTNCLDTWQKLFSAIEKRAGIVSDEGEEYEVTPLCGRSALNAASIPKGFAYDLLSYARQPGIWFVAPGVRLPKTNEFINQPFKDVARQFPKETEGVTMPILFFRCEGYVTSREAKFRWPFSTVEKVPCGLYLDAYPNKENPFQDACRLVLPFPLGTNKCARTSDGQRIQKSHVDLYGHGINPRIMRHGPKLFAILENWLANVENGHWDVDAQGVSGGVDVWKKADTEEDWKKYTISGRST